jgi:hypothetical protein
MQGLLKSLDKNGDGKVTIEDIQLFLEGLGLGSVSPRSYSLVWLDYFFIYNIFIHLDLSKALFKAVDRNGDGKLDLTDLMALAAIVSKLKSRFGSGANQQVPSASQNWYTDYFDNVSISYNYSSDIVAFQICCISIEYYYLLFYLINI